MTDNHNDFPENFPESILELKGSASCPCTGNESLILAVAAPAKSYIVYPCPPKETTDGGIAIPQRLRKSALGLIVAAGAGTAWECGAFVMLRSPGPVPMDLPHADGSTCAIPFLFVPEELVLAMIDPEDPQALLGKEASVTEDAIG